MGPKRHHWSDWAGFAFFFAIAGWQMVQYHTFSVLLMPLFMLPLLTGITFLLRRPLVAKLHGLVPSLSGYVSTFEVIVFLMFAQYVKPDWMAPNPNLRVGVIGLAIWLVALLLELFIVWSLRGSMSIEPQARKLITSGPFRYARHPLYTTYIMQHVGLWLRFNTTPLLIALVIWFIITLLRIRFEERVLSAAFPEYAEYRQRVWMFTPSFRANGLTAPTQQIE